MGNEIRREFKGEQTIGGGWCIQTIFAFKGECFERSSIC